jgi:hypothetical protein
MSKANLPDLSNIFQHVPPAATDDLPQLPDLPTSPGDQGVQPNTDVSIPPQAQDHLPDLGDVNPTGYSHLPDFLV